MMMLGFYTDSEESPSTRVTIDRIGPRLRASIIIDISDARPNGKQIIFTEVSYNKENGVIEMFKEGEFTKPKLQLNPNASYYFTGLIKDNNLQGQLANTLGRILELDLKLSKSD